MNHYTVTIRLTIVAAGPDQACAVGVGAAEHLAATFNDDYSLVNGASVKVLDSDPNGGTLAEDHVGF